jgi:hypothetical protein
MDVAQKGPILPNNFKTESEPPENDAKSARFLPEIPADDAQNASNSPPRVGEEPARSPSKGPGEGLTADKLTAPKPALERPVRLGGSEGKRGPRTPAGKKAVSRNAVKHGVRSPHPFIIEGLESPEEWEEFKLGIIESWQPLGMQELELAINVAWDHWKLRRCRLNENALLSKQVDETEEELQQEDADEDDLPEGAPLPAIDPERLVHHQHLKVIPDSWSMDRLLRYEAQVRKALNQDMNMLEVQQARRRGERTSLARVQVDSGPSFASSRNPNDIPLSQIAQIGQVVKARVRLAEDHLAAGKLGPIPPLPRERG